MLSFCAALLLAAPARPAAPTTPPGELAPPVKVLADGKPIDVDVGHAAPCVADLNGDGTLNLLVGQFREGKLRAYANTGSKTSPRFDKFSWVEAGGAECKVPSG
jgi:hypothetical protein